MIIIPATTAVLAVLEDGGGEGRGRQGGSEKELGNHCNRG